MNSPKKNQLIMILAVILVVPVIAACASPPEKDQARPVIKNDQSKIELKGDKGKLVIEGERQSLPKGFPDDMPIFEPSDVDSGVTSEGEEESPMKMAILKTNSKSEKIVDFYKKKLPEKGWNITSSLESSANVTNITASKGDDVSSISVGRDKETSGTVISINIVTR